MQVTSYSLPPVNHTILDLDLRLDGSWLAIAGEGSEQVLLFDGHTVPVPRPCQFPLVRAIGWDTAFLADCRVSGSAPNAWIVSSAGEFLAEFHAGDAIQDATAVGEKIVVSYFDEACTKLLNGVVVFDQTGQVLYNFHDVHDHDLTIVDCYAIAPAGGSMVVFLAYPNFPLVELDLESGRSKVWWTPEAVHGASAMSVSGGTVVFHGAYHRSNVFHTWVPGAKDAEQVGIYPGPLRGRVNGEFLAVGSREFTLVQPLA